MWIGRVTVRSAARVVAPVPGRSSVPLPPKVDPACNVTLDKSSVVPAASCSRPLVVIVAVANRPLSTSIVPALVTAIGLVKVREPEPALLRSRPALVKVSVPRVPPKNPTLRSPCASQMPSVSLITATFASNNSELPTQATVP